MSVRGLRNGAIAAFFASMGLLLAGGYFAKDKVPPVPVKVISEENELTDREAILRGQDVFQRYGLMDHGSVWGHGSLRGMDFSASTLHASGQHVRDYRAAGDRPEAGAYEKLPAERRAEIDARVILELRANRYDEASGTLELTAGQAYAFAENRKYW
ncbi:MAG: hypothetical protein JXA90_04745, partial [Planctomycetes bacterium]|nr:hypothetical protein [Planctomycetota bacterium]